MGSGYLDPFFRTLVKPVLGNRRERHSLLVPLNQILSTMMMMTMMVVVMMIRLRVRRGEKDEMFQIGSRLLLSLEGAKATYSKQYCVLRYERNSD